MICGGGEDSAVMTKTEVFVTGVIDRKRLSRKITGFPEPRQ
jgi:hypothetical protein